MNRSMRYIKILFFFVFQIIFSQNRVAGVFTDSLPKVKNIALYKLVNGESNYVKYVDVVNKSFSFPMDGLETGYYRVLYKNSQTGYVDFIFNQESIDLTVDSNIGQKSVRYISSKENQLLNTYSHIILGLQQKLDSIQMTFFTPQKANEEAYKAIREEVDRAQAYYEDIAKNCFCINLIRASKRHNPIKPYVSVKDYLNGVKNTFFKYIDFSNPNLKDATFLKRRVSDYVLYLHHSSNKEQANILYKQAVLDVVNLVENTEVKAYLVAHMIQKFVQKENPVLVSELVNIYTSLPIDVQDKLMLKELEQVSKTLIGVIAPDIKISRKESLHSLNDAEVYLVVFWSSTCSHCRGVLPKLDLFLRNKENIKVIAVGLEKKKDKQSWRNNIKFYKSWINVISLGKWESKKAIEYNVTSTPSYFLLDKDKRIIAKPETFSDLKGLLSY